MQTVLLRDECIPGGRLVRVLGQQNPQLIVLQIATDLQFC
jgi:hypothetical protein